jgi:hypothetical protein
MKYYFLALLFTLTFTALPIYTQESTKDITTKIEQTSTLGQIIKGTGLGTASLAYLAVGLWLPYRFYVVDKNGTIDFYQTAKENPGYFHQINEEGTQKIPVTDELIRRKAEEYSATSSTGMGINIAASSLLYTAYKALCGSYSAFKKAFSSTVTTTVESPLPISTMKKAFHGIKVLSLGALSIGQMKTLLGVYSVVKKKSKGWDNPDCWDYPHRNKERVISAIILSGITYALYESVKNSYLSLSKALSNNSQATMQTKG